MVVPTWLRSVSLSESLNRTRPPFWTSESSQNGAISTFVDRGKGRERKFVKEFLKDKTPFVLTCTVVNKINTWSHVKTRHMQSILGASLIELAALCWHSSGIGMCVHRLGCCRGGRGMLPTEVGQAASEAGD